MDTPRTPYPSDVTDDEWAFVSPYLVLMTEAAPQRTHDLRAVFNGLRWIVRTGCQERRDLSAKQRSACPLISRFNGPLVTAIGLACTLLSVVTLSAHPAQQSCPSFLFQPVALAFNVQRCRVV